MSSLLALAAKPEEFEILLISVTYGNVEVQRYVWSNRQFEYLTDRVCSCLRNTVALFHVIEKEMEWRKSKGLPVGFEAMQASKPIVAVGPMHPLEDELLMADYFRMFFCPS